MVHSTSLIHIFYGVWTLTSFFVNGFFHWGCGAVKITIRRALLRKNRNTEINLSAMLTTYDVYYDVIMAKLSLFKSAS